MSEIIKEEELIQQLKSAGINEGDTLFLRISYKSIGKVYGGPQTVINSIIKVIGPTGNILVTAFPRRIYSFQRFFKRNYFTSLSHRLPSNVGIIPKLISQMPHAMYSDHLTYPFLIIGHDAEVIAHKHNNESEPYSIIKDIAYNYNAKCLRIGGETLTGTTHVAFTEGLKRTNSFQKDLIQGLWVKNGNGKEKWQGDNVAFFCSNGYKDFYNKHIKGKELYVGMLGNGPLYLTQMKTTLEIELLYIGQKPEILLCNNPHCCTCRTSYSYSDSNKFKYLFFQIRTFLFEKSKRAIAFRNIKLIFVRGLFAKKIQ